MDYEICTTEAEVDQVIAELERLPVDNDMEPVVLDFETMAKSPGYEANDVLTALPCGLSMSWKEDQAVYIPLKHEDGNNLRFARIVENPVKELFIKLEKVVRKPFWCNHVSRFDWAIGRHNGLISLETGINFCYDTYIEAFLDGHYTDLFKSEQGGSDAGLKSIVLRLFGYQMRTFEEIAKFSDGFHIERVSAENAAWYACDDANWDRKVHKALYPGVRGKFLWNVEMSLSPIVQRMEEFGVPFNADVCNEQLVRVKEFTPQAQEIIFSQVEKQLGVRKIFDIGSPAQVAVVLFEDLKLPVVRKSRKTGRPSTDAKTLALLAKDFDVVWNILTQRKLIKVDTGYLATLPGYKHPDTGRIHSHYHQGGVPHGRFATSRPNVQNWSDEHTYIIKDGGNTHELVVNVRDAARCEDDELMLFSDYAQVEFWVAAELAKEFEMLMAISKGYDPHVVTASRMYHLALDAVLKEQRKKAKTRNYAMLYGETPESAAAKEGMDVDEMRELFRVHEQAIPRIMEDRRNVIASARKKWQVETYFGRIIILDQLYSHPDKKVQQKADRFAYNARIAGTAADIIKIGMVRQDKMLSKVISPVSLVQQNHDSLMHIFKLSAIERLISLSEFFGILKEAMEFTIPGFKLKPRMDYELGQSYGQKIKFVGQSWKQAVEQVRELRVQKSSQKKEDEDKPQIIKVIAEGAVLKEQLLALAALLASHPGKNVVFFSWIIDGKLQEMELSKFPTSLSLEDASKFQLLLPCAVSLNSTAEVLNVIASKLIL